MKSDPSNLPLAPDPDPEDLGQLFDRLEQLTREQPDVSFGDVLDVIGRRWYGPLLVVAGMVMVMPLVGDIPGVPIMMGLIVILISLQLFWKRKRVWLPGFLQSRRISSEKLRKGLKFLRGPVKVIDNITRPRLTWAVKHAGLTVIALTSMSIAALTPLLELIPFSATLAGASIMALGVSVLASDGIVGIIAIALGLSSVGFTASLLF